VRVRGRSVCWCLNCCTDVLEQDAIPEFRRLSRDLLTALVTIKDARHTNQVQGHTQLGIGLDVQGLLPRQTRGKSRRGILATGKANVRNVEQLRWVGRRGERIGISDARDEVLLNRPIVAAPRRGRRHGDGIVCLLLDEKQENEGRWMQQMGWAATTMRVVKGTGGMRWWWTSSQKLAGGCSLLARCMEKFPQVGYTTPGKASGVSAGAHALQG
jgi:hypothetical protein